LHAYAYAPNPIGWVDPLGLAKKKARDGKAPSPKESGCSCDCGNWTSHAGKHFPKKGMATKDIITSTTSGPAKYYHGISVQFLEMEAWQTGQPAIGSTHSRSYKIKKYNTPIGASEGKESRWVKVECSGGTLHGHPISELEYRQRGGL